MSFPGCTICRKENLRIFNITKSTYEKEFNSNPVCAYIIQY